MISLILLKQIRDSVIHQIGLLVWLFSTPTVLNASDASQASSLYQRHQNTTSPSPVVDSPPPSTSCGESTDTSNR